jgi:phosphopantothenoylcysteine decarboxylase/phosphopantothenate--cysteine ligase
MAEHGERGIGRMAEPLEILAAIEALAGAAGAAGAAGPAGTGAPDAARPLAGKRLIVTSGPTHEPIDPVRYIANRSSGKQGHAIAAAAAAAGASVVLVRGPVNLPDPAGVTTVKVETARQMLEAVETALPADAAVFAAAVADWRVAEGRTQKLKKTGNGAPQLTLVENPDILSTIAHRAVARPPLVIGFAAETEHVIEHAKTKLKLKGCDWIVANDVSVKGGVSVLGGDRNTVHIVTEAGVESWPPQSKEQVAQALVARMAQTLAGTGPRR